MWMVGVSLPTTTTNTGIKLTRLRLHLHTHTHTHYTTSRLTTHTHTYTRLHNACRKKFLSTRRRLAVGLDNSCRFGGMLPSTSEGNIIKPPCAPFSLAQQTDNDDDDALKRQLRKIRPQVHRTHQQHVFDYIPTKRAQFSYAGPFK